MQEELETGLRILGEHSPWNQLSRAPGYLTETEVMELHMSVLGSQHIYYGCCLGVFFGGGTDS